MQDKLLIVCTSERGKTWSFSVSKTKLKRTATVSAVMLVVFSILSFAGIKYSYQNVDLRIKATSLKRDLDHTRSDYEKFQNKVAAQEAEKENLLQTALSELKKRSQIIESILDTVGVEFQVEEESQNAGGPYTVIGDNSYENLTFKVDHYLETFQAIPLGTPTLGRITSKFGNRVDPINNRPAFHEGVDIKNEKNTPIKVTADGVVVKSGYTNGFGNYVVVRHGNGFVTRYFHLFKRAVSRGTAVKRGQVIGYLGSTGRSTGPHLHYEIRYQNKPVNPMKFMQVAKHIVENKPSAAIQ